MRVYSDRSVLILLGIIAVALLTASAIAAYSLSKALQWSFERAWHLVWGIVILWFLCSFLTVESSRRCD